MCIRDSNITNNYNVTLTDAQVDKIIALMQKIAAQNYDYNEMKATLNNVSDVCLLYTSRCV